MYYSLSTLHSPLSSLHSPLSTLHSPLSSNHLRKFFDECRSGSTAATYDVDQSLVDKFSDFWGHCLWGLIVETHRVGQSGIGIGADVVGGTACQVFEERLHLVGTERTVQTNREDGVVADRSEKGFECLSAQCSSCQVADGHAQHDRQLLAETLHRLHSGIDGYLGVERVKDGLYENRVNTAFDKSLHLLGVGIEQQVVGQLAGCRIAHVGRHGAGLVRRTYRASHETRFLGGCILVGCLSG